MKLLAIDTSNYTLGIALLEEDKVLGEYITNMKKNHSIRVMPAIEKLLKDCDTKPAELDKIVVAEGPGSYTGVRIGVTIAKTLAWSLNIPLSGVSSLAVQAASAGKYFDGLLSPIFDARRGQVYTGLYRYEGGFLKKAGDDELVLSKNWAEQLKQQSERVLFLGNDVSIHRDQLVDILGDKAVFSGITEMNPRPAELALLGKNTAAVDVHTFVPNYIRLAEAESKWLEENKKQQL
jgi:tRNA threonylcarbamoyladenosine biosynthesis protein TsaB